MIHFSFFVTSKKSASMILHVLTRLFSVLNSFVGLLSRNRVDLRLTRSSLTTIATKLIRTNLINLQTLNRLPIRKLQRPELFFMLKLLIMNPFFLVSASAVSNGNLRPNSDNLEFINQSAESIDSSNNLGLPNQLVNNIADKWQTTKLQLDQTLASSSDNKNTSDNSSTETNLNEKENQNKSDAKTKETASKKDEHDDGEDNDDDETEEDKEESKTKTENNDKHQSENMNTDEKKTNSIKENKNSNDQASTLSNIVKKTSEFTTYENFKNCLTDLRSDNLVCRLFCSRDNDSDEDTELDIDTATDKHVRRISLNLTNRPSIVQTKAATMKLIKNQSMNPDVLIDTDEFDLDDDQLDSTEYKELQKLGIEYPAQKPSKHKKNVSIRFNGFNNVTKRNICLAQCLKHKQNKDVKDFKNLTSVDCNNFCDVCCSSTNNAKNDENKFKTKKKSKENAQAILGTDESSENSSGKNKININLNHILNNS